MRLDQNSEEKMIRTIYSKPLFDKNLSILISKCLHGNLFLLSNVLLLEQHIDTAAQEGTAYHRD